MESDWDGSLSDQKNTGIFFRLGSCTVTWSLKKQDVAALSMTEAEYIAATSVACQMVWLRRIPSDCGRKSNGSSVL